MDRITAKKGRTNARPALKLHVYHPLFNGRSVCGRQLPDRALATPDVYRHTPREHRCRKCAPRIVGFEKMIQGRVAALATPGRQRLFCDGDPL